jgi:hypothetical protein
MRRDKEFNTPPLEQLIDSLVVCCRAVCETSVDDPHFLSTLSELSQFCKVSSISDFSPLWDFNIPQILLSFLDTPVYCCVSLDCLAVLAACDESISEFLVENGIFPLLCPLFFEFTLFPTLFTLLSNIAGSTELCRFEFFRSISFSILSSLLPKIDSNAQLMRLFARILMSLAHGPIPSEVCCAHFDLLVYLLNCAFPDVTQIAFWSLHYFLGNCLELPTKFTELSFVDRIATTLHNGQSGFALVCMELLRDILRMAPELLSDFNWTLIVGQLSSSEAECVRVASLCVKEWINSQNEPISSEFINEIAMIFVEAPFGAKHEIAVAVTHAVCVTSDLTALTNGGILEFFRKCVSIDDCCLIKKMIRVVERLIISGLSAESLTASGVLMEFYEAAQRCDDEIICMKLEILCERVN